MTGNPDILKSELGGVLISQGRAGAHFEQIARDLNKEKSEAEQFASKFFPIQNDSQAV